MEDFIIKIDNLHYKYEDGKEALKGISFNIKKGEKIAILGPNGSGKSTFLLTLNGIHKPTKGNLYFNGKPYNYSKKSLLNLRSKIGVIFQDSDNQLFSSSVFQEISFGVLNLGIDENTCKKLVEQVIEELDITPFRNKPTYALSGGQKKQVSIADILVMNPEVIILDEPTSSLDPKHTAMVYNIIDKLNKKNITVILSTHDVNYAYKWAEKIIVFSEGKVLKIGSPKDIFNDTITLKKANLEKPYVLNFFECLVNKNILSSNLELPKSFEDLENYINNI